MTVALVTGASAGIGAAFARRLATDGYDVVAVARDAARLEALAKELPTRTEVLPADLTVPDELARVEARVRKGVDLLVNNAGFGTTGRFVELPVDGEEREIRLNVLAVVRLTHAALEAMLARGAGGIINVSSVAGFQPAPTNATYTATKAFVTTFTESVYEELRGTGIRVLALCPGFTRTEFQQRAGYDARQVPGPLWMRADEVVDEALAALRRGKAICVPGGLNRAAVAFAHLAPRGVARRVAGMVNSRFTG
jgi:hypothetical protein